MIAVEVPAHLFARFTRTSAPVVRLADQVTVPNSAFVRISDSVGGQTRRFTPAAAPAWVHDNVGNLAVMRPDGREHAVFGESVIAATTNDAARAAHRIGDAVERALDGAPATSSHAADVAQARGAVANLRSAIDAFQVTAVRADAELVRARSVARVGRSGDPYGSAQSLAFIPWNGGASIGRAFDEVQAGVDALRGFTRGVHGNPPPVVVASA